VLGTIRVGAFPQWRNAIVGDRRSAGASRTAVALPSVHFDCADTVSIKKKPSP
jgi:hypothetical protein